MKVSFVTFNTFIVTGTWCQCGVLQTVNTPVMADASRVSSVILNPLANAHEASREMMNKFTQPKIGHLGLKYTQFAFRTLKQLAIRLSRLRQF